MQDDNAAGQGLALGGDEIRALRHDFSNALGVVLGSLRLIAKEHGDDRDTRELIETAINSCSDLQEVMRRAIAKLPV